MTEHEKLHGDPNWIAGKRFGHDLRRLVERYPEGAPDRVSAGALMVEEAEVEALWQGILAKLAARATGRAL